MAKPRDSPAMFSGQAWTAWVERIESPGDFDASNPRDKKDTTQADAMKLRTVDMSLFGFCPVQDEFYLVVCEFCGQVIKPQAFKTHIELRHGGCAFSSLHISASSVDPAHADRANPTPSLHPQNSGAISTSPPKSKPRCSPTQSKMATLQNSSSRLKTNSKAGSAMPVVKVERMPELSALTATATTPGGAPLSDAAPHSPVPSPSPAEPPLPKPPPPPSPPGTPPLMSVEVVAPPLSAEMTFVSACLAEEQGAPRYSMGPPPDPLPISMPVAKPPGERRKSKKRASGERKIVPLKDREFDPEKHCGVCTAETGQRCTRSLTCKTHAVSMRRAVPGRSKDFDKLLDEHRAARDASLGIVRKKHCAEDRLPSPTTQDVAPPHGTVTSAAKPDSFPFPVVDQSNTGFPKSKPRLTQPLHVVKERPPGGVGATLNATNSSVDVKAKPPDGASVAFNLPGTITIPLSAMSGALTSVQSSGSGGMTTATINLTPSSLGGAAMSLGASRLPGGTVNLTMTLVSNKNSELAALQGKALSAAAAAAARPGDAATAGALLLAENGQPLSGGGGVRTCANVKKIAKPPLQQQQGKPRSPGAAHARALAMPALAATGLIFDTAMNAAAGGHAPTGTVHHVTSVPMVARTPQSQQNMAVNTNLPNGFAPPTLAGGNIILKGALANSFTRSTSSPSPTVNLDHLNSGLNAQNIQTVTFSKPPTCNPQPQFINLSTLATPAGLQHN
ncbi:PREDICTED: ataxin-7-like protein 1 [Priapulus caudatus]|uniref:Ataxin-7-like protein 1 n=1 Tax=Priapulus caudatus TaxID=37621 RepID=A0ABM1E601_PRICU|nr:PREDICTED: ataxin-7-like protein 1 [Priapulus caudatus]